VLRETPNGTLMQCAFCGWFGWFSECWTVASDSDDKRGL
jgi:hypothetical protein